MRNHKTKSADHDELTAGIVTSDAVAKTSNRRFLHVPHISARLFFTVLIVCATVVAAGYGAYVLLGNNKNLTNKPEVVKSPRDKVNELSSRLDAAGNSAKALKAAQDELVRLEAGATTQADKEIYSLASADLYRQANQLDDALAQAKKAEKAYKTALSAATLAEVYRARNDFANAAKYYGIASERSPKTAPTERSAYNEYRIMKENLESQL
jgi:hypothetical protein